MLTARQIANMFELQDKLNRTVKQEWADAGYDWPLAIMAECTELIDQIGWKWWKHQEQAPLTQIQLEVVDIWHFLMSMVIESDLFDSAAAKMFAEPNEWFLGVPIEPKHVIHRAKVLSATAGLYGGSPLRLLPEFFSLMRACRLSFDDLYQLYMAKAVLNLFRWANGYKQGTYIKQWGDVEDNVHLESIIRAKPDLSHNEITALLHQRYQEVTA